MKTNKGEITKTLGFKVFLIFMLVLSLNIASSFIKSIIYDRQYHQREATESIIDPIGGAFNLNVTGISIPFHYYSEDKDGKVTKEKDYTLILPNKYIVNADTKTNILSRGIFKTPVYTADVEIIAEFAPFEVPKVDYTVEYLYNEAIIFISTTNKQNFLAMPLASIADEKLKESNISIQNLGNITRNAFVFDLDKNDIRKGFTFEAKLNIQGGGNINILPMAGDNEITLTSDWADPSFVGTWLPTKRDINEEGFSATWQIPSFNTPFDSTVYVRNGLANKDLSKIQTSFLLLNDTYQKSMRSIKYSLLFICVPFFALFLCEMLTRRKIHVIQYALIGLANVIFYLLLLSISEHTNFNLAYILSSIMVIGLSSLYVAALTKMKKLGIVIAVVEGLIYIFLFGILQLTDYALLVGSLGMFTALAIAMYFTRNISQYLEENNEGKAENAEDNEDTDKFSFK